MNKISKSIFCLILFCVAFAVGSLNVFAQKGDVGEEIRVKFPRGKTSIVFAGKIKNNLEGPIYLVGVGANQKMSVRLISASGAVEIVITAPGSKESAFVTEREKNRSVIAAETGDCRIIINPKRDNFSYKLEITVR